jgi:hypothetical protein
MLAWTVVIRGGSVLRYTPERTVGVGLVEAAIAAEEGAPGALPYKQSHVRLPTCASREARRVMNGVPEHGGG